MESRSQHHAEQNLVISSFKTEKWLSDAIRKYTKSHHMSKSNFIREAIIQHLERLSDIEAFERTKNDKIYSLAEVEAELGLED